MDSIKDHQDLCSVLTLSGDTWLEGTKSWLLLTLTLVDRLLSQKPRVLLAGICFDRPFPPCKTRNMRSLSPAISFSPEEFP